jgi:hypothetical protein
LGWKKLWKQKIARNAKLEDACMMRWLRLQPLDPPAVNFLKLIKQDHCLLYFLKAPNMTLCLITWESYSQYLLPKKSNNCPA